MDGDGTCDALDDIDGDGVLNDEDFAPEDPSKLLHEDAPTPTHSTKPLRGHDSSCFTPMLKPLVAAMAGMMEATDMEMGITTNMIYDGDHIRLISMSITGEDGEGVSPTSLTGTAMFRSNSPTQRRMKTTT